MSALPMVSEILDNAASLGKEDFESLFKKLSILRVQRNNIPSMGKTEADLLEQIHQGFSAEKWERLQFLDWKMESSGLNDRESTESLQLAEAYENYTVQRLQLLIKLAALRNVTLEEVMQQLEIGPKTHG